MTVLLYLPLNDHPHSIPYTARLIPYLLTAVLIPLCRLYFPERKLQSRQRADGDARYSLLVCAPHYIPPLLIRSCGISLYSNLGHISPLTLLSFPFRPALYIHLDWH